MRNARSLFSTSTIGQSGSTETTLRDMMNSMELTRQDPYSLLPSRFARPRPVL